MQVSASHGCGDAAHGDRKVHLISESVSEYDVFN